MVAKNNTIIPSPSRVQLKLNHPIKNKTRTISLFQPPQTLISVPHIVSPTKKPIPSTKPSKVTPIHIVPQNKSTLPKASSLIPHKAKLSHEKAANIRESKRKRKPNSKYQVLQYLKSKYSTINSYLVQPVIDSNTGASLEFRHLRRGPNKILWDYSFSNELGRLANGMVIRMEKGTKRIQFRERSAVPQNIKGNIRTNSCIPPPPQSRKNRVRLTVGGNLIDYDGYASTPTTYLTTTIVFINSIISTNKSRLATIDI